MILMQFINAIDYVTRKEVYKGQALVQLFEELSPIDKVVGNMIQNVGGTAYIFTPFIVVKVDGELLKKLDETKVTDSNYYLPYLWRAFD